MRTKRAAAIVACSIATMLLCPPVSIAALALGESRSPTQVGYGETHPKTIFNGGDPTGLVTHIHWRHWGAKKAFGWGRSIFVWPGTSVAEGLSARARIVAFHRGMCNEVPSYNAVEWFFPTYHQSFAPGQYSGTCSGEYSGFRYHPSHCRAVDITRQSRAVSVTTQHLSCRRARRVIASSPAQRYAVSGGRFIHRRYYCGTQGWIEGEPPAIFECALDRHSVVFEIDAPG